MKARGTEQTLTADSTDAHIMKKMMNAYLTPDSRRNTSSTEEKQQPPAPKHLHHPKQKHYLYPHPKPKTHPATYNPLATDIPPLQIPPHHRLLASALLIYHCQRMTALCRLHPRNPSPRLRLILERLRSPPPLASMWRSLRSL